jgi:hypothetical protein
MVETVDPDDTLDARSLTGAATRESPIAEVQAFPESIARIPRTTLTSLRETAMEAVNNFSRLEGSLAKSATADAEKLSRPLEKFQKFLTLLDEFKTMQSQLAERIQSGFSPPYVPV